MILSQGPQDNILEIVCILIFINEYELELGLDLCKSIREMSQQTISVQQDIVKIHHPLFLAACLVKLVYLAYLGTPGPFVRLHQFRVVQILLRGYEVVLALRNAAGNLSRLIDLVIQLHLLDTSFDHSLAVILVINGKSRRKIQQSGILP